VKKNGIDSKLFEQTLHEIEFAAKKTRANTGLMYISHLVPYALHGGDPLTVFKINEFSQRLRDDFKKGKFFEGLVEKHMLGNPHYLRLLYTPDPKKAEKEEAQDKKQLAALEKALTNEEKQTIIKDTLALKKHQESLQDHEVLPTLTLADIPKQIEFVDKDVRAFGNVKLTFFDQPTNGISYVRVKCNLNNLP
jgi:Zn-dependent M16 (insulinase) family peptidase